MKGKKGAEEKRGIQLSGSFILYPEGVETVVGTRTSTGLRQDLRFWLAYYELDHGSR
jgi:hypothetical protein